VHDTRQQAESSADSQFSRSLMQLSLGVSNVLYYRLLNCYFFFFFLNFIFRCVVVVVGTIPSSGQ
jgi:hypothetical protein